MENILQQKLVAAAELVERQLDQEIEKLDNIDINDLDKLREKRLQELKKQHEQKQTWLSLGHGEYSELTTEKEFFDIGKKSENIVCLFYKNDVPRCKILDHHLRLLVKKHLEAKFCKINAEKCPFLIERLRIKHIPTIALVVKNKTKDYIVGFNDLGNRDDFPTEALEYRISLSGAITYTGDYPKNMKKGGITNSSKFKTIRGNDLDDSDDD